MCYLGLSSPYLVTAMDEDLDNYVGCLVRITGPMFNGPVMLKLLTVEPERIFVERDTGEPPFWLSLSEIKIG